MSDTWEDVDVDKGRFKRGIFKSKDDCEAFAKAYYRPWQELVE